MPTLIIKVIGLFVALVIVAALFLILLGIFASAKVARPRSERRASVLDQFAIEARPPEGETLEIKQERQGRRGSPLES
jgi:hypothetical protein